MEDKDRSEKTIEQARIICDRALLVLRLVQKIHWYDFALKHDLRNVYESFGNEIRQASQWHEHCCFAGPERRNLETALNLAEYIYHQHLPKGME